MFKVIFYRKCNGESPVEKFLLSLDIKMRAKVLRAINLLADFGNKLREPDSKLLEDGIFELRVKLGSDIVRVLYFFCEGRIVVLTNGFVKKEPAGVTIRSVLNGNYRKLLWPNL